MEYRLIFRIGYKRLHEEKMKKTIRSRKSCLYTLSLQLKCVLIRPYSYSYVCTCTYFSHATESRTDNPTECTSGAGKQNQSFRTCKQDMQANPILPNTQANQILQNAQANSILTTAQAKFEPYEGRDFRRDTQDTPSNIISKPLENPWTGVIKERLNPTSNPMSELR